ncbi:AbiV family abortive infection protein [Mucilaginibacter conchicola]|uniref:AbiV family abortive infection protein n=1 Tax=Mucilaginibacter conchicola TaxID=2303333 RepID=A0A372NWA8_9SPHI|nr:AbiV family abortive infection protein [Mucilaginibacter conchicola]RFZ94141.1 AbiV family abortive infection protein [Mucilaginibacter conchicola]
MASDKPTNLFRSLDAEGCKHIYPKVKKNADRHFNAAELLVQSGDYANSVAHLILGSEELIKSFVLVLQAYEFPVKKIANYDKLFTHHTARHNLLKEFYSVYRFIRGIVEWPEWKQGQSFLSNFSKVLSYSVNILNNSIANYEWWDKADQMKQHCFYLDYNSRGTVDPISIDHNAFETTRTITHKFREDLRLMVIIIERASSEDLATLKDAFVSTGMTEQIDESITRKKSK